MVNKKIYKYEDIKEKILHAVDAIVDPVAQTLSPLGSNVVLKDGNENLFWTNDGATIAKSIRVADEVEDAIIEIIRTGSMKTNTEVGDSTSSTILGSGVLIKEGLRLVENGHNRMELRDELNKFATDMQAELDKMAIKVKGDEDLRFVASVSASNDSAIADDVVRIVKFVGLDGQVMIDRGFSATTEIIEDSGFVLKSGVFSQELTNKQYQTGMLDVPVLITDKKLYYKAEAETILRTVLNAGYNEVVIIAQDFIGEALPYFIANHVNNKVRVILVTEKKQDILEDLAIYLGGEVVSDKKGSLVDNITIDNFVMAKRVFSDPVKTIVSRYKEEKNKVLDERIKVLKAQLEKNKNKNDPEYERLQSRISSLTNGMVTIKVGGSTPMEVMERIYRYEDAINAARAALREGYLPGAGVAMRNAFLKLKVKPEYDRMFRSFAEANIRQIAKNCEVTPDIVISNIENSKIDKSKAGFNAVTKKVEDVVKSGIIEPVLATKNVVANAVSVANIIITSRYFVVNDLEEVNKNNK